MIVQDMLKKNNNRANSIDVNLIYFLFTLNIFIRTPSALSTYKMKFPIKDFFSKCDQIHRKLRIWSDLLKKSLIESFIFCAVIHVFLLTHFRVFMSQRNGTLTTDKLTLNMHNSTACLLLTYIY